jgi:WS/DGAT/MGAT family acyltransferase
MDRGRVPEQFGVVLELSGHLSLAQVRELISVRIGAVPRLRQRLVSAPFGCGGPVWIDDPGFDLRHHVREVACRAPGDEQQLLDTALAAVMTPLRSGARLWSVVLLSGLRHGRSALVVVLHHALADGIGGLDVLATLVDPGSAIAGPAFPQPAPDLRSLFTEAMTARTRALFGVIGSWRLLRSSMAAGGGLRPPRIATCSLMQPTGPNRQVLVVRSRYDGLRAVAHRFGATTNDAVLVVVAGALRQLLERRGERVDSFVITVPVSGRRADEAHHLGNLVSPLLVPVPATGPLGQRLARVAAAVRAGKAEASGPAPIALLGWLFRPLCRLGAYRWYMNHQRRFHTLVSHVRGPDQPLSFGGLRVETAIPIGVAEAGNSTVYFEVLTYRGLLTITAIIDPDHFPDADTLAPALESELRALAWRRLPATGGEHPNREVSAGADVTSREDGNGDRDDHDCP